VARDPAGERAARVREAVRIARYLIGREPAAELVERYVAACARVFPAGKPSAEERYLVRSPKALPWLDAGATVLRPDSILRRKVLLMAAILEASPHHVDFFLRSPGSRVAAFTELGLQGLRAVVAFVVGVPLFWWVTRGR